MNAKINSKGFTLIEVLVALTIIAITLGALLSTSGTQARQVSYLKQKSIAHWVAMNEMTQLHIEKAFPDSDKNGSTEMAGVKWFWTRKVLKVELKTMRQITFEIYVDKERTEKVANLIGYVSKNKDANANNTQ